MIEMLDHTADVGFDPGASTLDELAPLMAVSAQGAWRGREVVRLWPPIAAMS